MRELLLEIWNFVALAILMTIPMMFAIRAYRIGYKAGSEDRKLRETLKRRYSSSTENKTE